MVQKDSLKKPLIVVCGPTASGKTRLAVQLAKRLNTSVISADSIAIYKRLNIGTAKPSVEEMDGVKHYLIDYIDAEKDYTVAEYACDAKAIIDKLHAENKVPIICGGTGYYIDSVLYDMSYGNCPKDDNIRHKYSLLLEQRGAAYLYELLKKVDEQTYNVLHENDVVRVIRALEIYELTGKKKSETIDEKVALYNYAAFSFDYDRERLYDRINKRVENMFDNGLWGEVEGLLNDGPDKSCQSMQAIGYKEIVEAIYNGLSEEDTKELIKRNTRRYAKRQITYFKRLKGLNLLDPDNYDLDAIIAKLKDGSITY